MATVNGAAALAGGAVLTAAGVRGKVGSASLPAGAVLHATAVLSRQGAAALTASARLGAYGGLVQRGRAAFSASPSLQVSGTATLLAAAPRLAATGRVVKTAGAALTASPALHAAGFVPTMAAQPSLSVSALVTERAAAPLSATAHLTVFFSSASASLHASPTLLAPGRQGSIVMSAGTQLTASGQYFMPGAASLSAAAALAAVPRVTEQGRAPLAAPAVLSAVPLVTESPAAHLAATSALAASWSSAVAHLSAGAALSVAPTALRLAVAHLSAAGVLASQGSVARRAAAVLAAPGAISASARNTSLAHGALAAHPVLSANAHHLLSGQAHLASAASLSAAGKHVSVAIAALHAAAALAVTASTSRSARLSASPSLTAHGAPGRPARAVLAAGAALTVTARGTTHPIGALRAAPSMAVVPLAVITTRAAVSALAILTAAGDARLVPPPAIPPAGPQPTWQRDIQHFAIAQERQRHAQALWQYGELVMFCLLWRPADLDAGLAARCPRCFSPSVVIAPVVPEAGYSASAESQISAAYGQGNQYRCTLCYGTQLIAAAPAAQPGVRALLVRPAILTDTDQGQQRTAKGVVSPGSVSVQATPDFRAYPLDYMFRSDGRRYQLSLPARTTLRTGFATPWQQAAAVSYNLMSATLEDQKASVAYAIPPDEGTLAQALGTYTRIPASYAWAEQLNGPLIPGESPPPAASGRYQPPVAL